MTDNEPKKYTREDYVYLSKLNEKAERYPEMITFIKEMIKLNPKLNKEECDILSTGYKNMITDKRNNWRILNSMLRKELKEDKKSKNIKNIEEIKYHVESEIKAICKDLQNLIDEYLIPKVDQFENEVCFYTLKADYFRYLCEITKGSEFEENIKKSEEFYKKAYNIALKNLPVNNCTRVGLGLNYAIFLYEIKEDKKAGFGISKSTFDECMRFVDDLERPKYKDTLMIIQLIKENIIFWSSEMNDDDNKIE